MIQKENSKPVNKKPYRYLKNYLLDTYYEAVVVPTDDGELKERYEGRNSRLSSHKVCIGAEGRGIEWISGLEKFTGLVTLWLNDNKISRIERLENCTNLVELRLDKNQIRVIENLPLSLKELDLSHNVIEKIEGIEKLKELEELRLGHNKLRRISGFEAPFKKLRVLDLSYNRIRDTNGLEKLKSLRGLHMNFTRVRGLFPQSLKRLCVLGLRGVKMKVIKGLEYLKNLTHLDLSDNKITKMEGLDNMIKLEELKMGRNRIVKIEGLMKMPKLSTLELDGNRITRLSEELVGLKNLRVLKVIENPLTVDAENFLLFEELENRKGQFILRVDIVEIFRDDAMRLALVESRKDSQMIPVNTVVQFSPLPDVLLPREKVHDDRLSQQINSLCVEANRELVKQNDDNAMTDVHEQKIFELKEQVKKLKEDKGISKELIVEMKRTNEKMNLQLEESLKGMDFEKRKNEFLMKAIKRRNDSSNVQLIDKLKKLTLDLKKSSIENKTLKQEVCKMKRQDDQPKDKLKKLTPELEKSSKMKTVNEKMNLELEESLKAIDIEKGKNDSLMMIIKEKSNSNDELKEKLKKLTLDLKKTTIENNTLKQEFCMMKRQPERPGKHQKQKLLQFLIESELREYHELFLEEGVVFSDLPHLKEGDIDFLRKVPLKRLFRNIRKRWGLTDQGKRFTLRVKHEKNVKEYNNLYTNLGKRQLFSLVFKEFSIEPEHHENYYFKLKDQEKIDLETSEIKVREILETKIIEGVVRAVFKRNVQEIE